MKRFLLLLSLLTAITGILRAVPVRSAPRVGMIPRGGYGPGAGTTIWIYDKAERENDLSGATVEIISGADTLRGAATRYNSYIRTAQYRCDKLFRDSVDLKITYLGYKEFHKRFSAYDFAGVIDAPLEQDEQAIGQVVVLGEQVAMVFRGDTIVYNAGAYKTLADDRFAELLRQLPGVEIRENKIYSDGKEVKRVYVDGRNFFGDSPQFALTDMTAADVRSIKVYEEQSREAKFRNDRTAEKERVMDVETKSKRRTLMGGEAVLIGGASIERDYSGRREVRHAGQLSLHRHNEKGSLRLSAANSKDLGNMSETDMQSKITPTKRTRAEAHYGLRRGDTTMVSTRFSFSRDRTGSTTRSLTDYFPTDDYRLRLDDRLSDALAKNLSASVGNTTMFQRRNHNFSTELSLRFSDRTSQKSNRSTQAIDDDVTRTHLNSDDRNRSLTLSAGISYTLRISEKSSFFATVSGTCTDQEQDGWQVDTLSSVPGLRTMLQNDGHTSGHKIEALAAYRLNTGESSSLSLIYTFSWNSDRAKRLSVDFLDDPQGRLDSLNSYRYTNRETSHALTASWHYNKGDLYLNAIVNGSLRKVSRDEKFPDESHFPRRFFTVEPGLHLAVGKPQRRWIFALYGHSQSLPTESLRPTLNTTDPQWLRAGNPELKIPVGIDGSVRYSLTDSQSARSMSFAVNGSYTFNYIATQRTLFLEPTYLPAYDYTAQKGAQLTTQLNVGGCYRAEGNLQYSQQLLALRSTLNVNLHYNFRSTPYFIDAALHDSDNHTLSASVGLSTGFSTNVRIDLASTTSLGRSSTREATTGDLTERVHAQIDLRFGKYFGFVGTAYEFYCNNRSKSLTRHSVLLNASAGRKFGAKDRFSLSLGAVDILNRPDYMQTLFETDYIRTTSVSYLGRYLYLRAAYTF